MGTVLPALRDARRRRWLVSAIVGLALVVSLAVYRTWWAPPFAWALYLLALAGMGMLGLEFVLAGLVGQPGCESQVLPNLLRLRKGHVTVEPCPLWDRIDAWERRCRNSALKRRDTR